MIGLRVFDLLVLLVVFCGVASVAFAVILNKESSNKPQPPQSNPYQQMPPVQQVPPAQQVSTMVDDAQPVEPAHFCALGGSRLEANASFCQNCGAKKPAGVPQYRCDKCGWEPEDPAHPPKFCPECGDPFDDGDVIG